MSGPPQCCDNPPTLNASSGGGHVEELGGVKAYVSGTPNSSSLAVLLVSDIYGFEAPNLRKLADKVAAAGFYVVVPDLIYEPYDPSNTEKSFQVWLKDHGPDKGFEDVKPVLEAIKHKGVSSIGAAGFCWGAKVVVELAKASYIEAAVLLHPSLVSVDDIKAVKAPISVLGAEIDKMSPPELLKEFEEVLKAEKTVDSYVKIFPGVAHGWSVRYSLDDQDAVKRAEESHQDMLGWLSKHVKRLCYPVPVIFFHRS